MQHEIINLTWIAITLIMAFAGVILTKNILNLTKEGSKWAKQRSNMQSTYIDDLETKVKKLQGSLKRQEVGPKYDEDSSFSDIIPSLIGDISQFLPKSLQPLLKDEGLQKVLIKQVMDNPDQFKGIIKGLLKKKGDAKQDVSSEGAL